MNAFEREPVESVGHATQNIRGDRAAQWRTVLLSVLADVGIAFSSDYNRHDSRTTPTLVRHNKQTSPHKKLARTAERGQRCSWVDEQRYLACRSMVL